MKGGGAEQVVAYQHINDPTTEKEEGHCSTERLNCPQLSQTVALPEDKGARLLTR